jgi:hypothetical protein
VKTAGGPWFIVGLAMAMAPGCQGTIGEPASGAPGQGVGSHGGGGANGVNGGGAGGAATGGAGPSNASCSSLEPIPRRLWRLSVDQYANAVKDLLGLAEPPAINTAGGTSVP